MTFENFWDAQSAWSQATFGTDTERGPIGALKHLAKEVAETLANPTDSEEYVDCLFLVFDASRRSGLTKEKMLELAFKKLEKNKRRVWQKANGDEPSEHVRGIHD